MRVNSPVKVSSSQRRKNNNKGVNKQKKPHEGVMNAKHRSSLRHLLTVCAGNDTNLLHTPTKQQLCSSQLLTVNLKSAAENTDGRLNGWTSAQKSRVPSQMRLCGWSDGFQIIINAVMLSVNLIVL